MAHLAQPQQKLQLNYKTTITQKHQKIKLYGSLTTKKLKKSHSSRQVGGVEMWRHAEKPRDTGSPILMCGRLKWGGISLERGIPAPHQTTHPEFHWPGR